MVCSIVLIKIKFHLTSLHYRFVAVKDIYEQRNRYSEDLASVKRQLEREQELRTVERNSRISAQQKLRKFLSTTNVANDNDTMLVSTQFPFFPALHFNNNNS